MKNYKDTLNMPKTNFEMRAKLVTKEPLFRQRWLDNNLYQKRLQKNEQNEQYVLHDGPPYANGDLHCGHALNKILKDIVVRYKSMQGFYSPYIPGWDTHGLPIENKMLKLHAKNHQEYSVVELRKQAAKYALSQIKIQKEQFKKMQLLSDMNHIYYTMDPKFEASQLRLFHQFVKKDLIFKALKPVYWSPSSESALAEAEIEYQMFASPSIYVAVSVTKVTEIIPKNTKLVIWTTTPWTLLANAAIAIGEKIDYVLVKNNDEHFILASDRLNDVKELCHWDDLKIIKQLKPSDIVGLKYQRPFGNKTGDVIYGHHVTTESGSGLVHIAPLFGEDDFILGKKNQLDMIMHIDDKGFIFNSAFTKVNSIFYLDANKSIGLDLDSRGQLLSLKFKKHRLPFDWRTNKPVMYRGTDQWFVSIKKIQKEILSALEDVSFYSTWSKKRLTKMIEGRDEWCISRQRSWGVPIIIFYDQNKKPLFNDDIFEHVIKLVEKHGSDIWYEKSVDELLPKQYQNLGFSKENDIMDVWFDSGSSSCFDLKSKINKPYELYFEGSDQYRGWFNSSLVSSTAFRGKAPFKNLVSHGFVLDKKGDKMSKSKGNVVDPLKIINAQGADILRLWVANSEYKNDVIISDGIIKQNVEYYRRIRNTFKFMLGNIQDFDFNLNKQKLTGYHLVVDEKIKKLHNQIIKYYDNFDFMKVIKRINEFFVQLSGFYFDTAKDILYVEKVNNLERRMIQTNIYNIIEICLIALAPLIPTTCEDIYDHFNKKNKLESVHLENFKKPFVVNSNHAEKWNDFFTLKDEVYKKLEEAKKNKIINRNNEALVYLNTKSSFLNSQELKFYLMIGKVIHSQDIKVAKFISVKCQRCWNHYDEKEIKNAICQRCQSVLKA